MVSTGLKMISNQASSARNLHLAGDIKMTMRKLTWEQAVRAFADLIILNASLSAALLFQHLECIRLHGSCSFLFVPSFLVRSATLLSVIGLSTFALAGFYTKGRAYSSRYKLLVILQATSVAFLIFATVQYVLGLPFPRLTLLSAWGICAIGLAGARMWALIWKRVLAMEHQEICVEDVHVRKVLLIGGAGYIGSALLPKLLARGYKVRLLDMFIYGDEPIAKVAGHPNLQIIKSDFRKVDQVVRAMQGMEAVIHLGAIVGDPACALDEDLTVEINLIATRLLAEVAKGHGISRFIFASTCSVYGASDELLNERSALNPVSLYARSKIASERVLLELQDERFRPVILRFGTIYGLSGRTRFDLVVNLLAAKAIIDGKITVFGSDQWRPFVHVEDAAKAVILALESRPDVVRDPIFNVGSDEQNRTVGQIGELIKRIVPEADLLISDSNSDRRNYRVSFQKIRTVLRFKPEWQLEDGVQQVIDAIYSGQVQSYSHPKYSNVRYLAEEINPEMLKAQNGWVENLLEQTVNGEGRRQKYATAAYGS